MIWAAVIIGIILLWSFIILLVMSALKLSKQADEISLRFIDAHKATLASLERTHERNVAQNSSVLDRFMALDFSLFKAYQSSELAEEGGFEEPTDEDLENTGVISFNDGGRVTRPGATIEEQLRLAQEEGEILAEDFGEDFERKEGLR
jgi:hypothetical protein